MSFKAQQRYIDRSTGNIIISKILRDAIPLPTKKNSLEFYKPYKKENELYHMMMFQVLEVEENIYVYKTLYDVNTALHKVAKIIKAMDLNTVYFKYEEVNGECSGN